MLISISSYTDQIAKIVIFVKIWLTTDNSNKHKRKQLENKINTYNM